MARRTKQEAEETRGRILTAALEVIYEKGYARSTFVDIAERINLTKGAVYWHFRNKPEMFLALGREMEERIGITLNPMLTETDTLDELKQALFEIIRIISEDEQLRKYYTIVYYRMEWTDELRPLKTFFDQQEKAMLNFIFEIFKKSQKNADFSKAVELIPAAGALSALVDGLIGHGLFDSDESNKNRLKSVQTGLDIFFAGMQTDR